MESHELLKTVDVRVWAQEFVDRFPRDHFIAETLEDYRNTMAGWFANAMAAAENRIARESHDHPSGIALISSERRRQIIEEGWSAEHDDSHTDSGLALAGACYAASADRFDKPHSPKCDVFKTPPVLWPWGSEWWKPGPTALRMLVKAGALIAAEIDRRLRAGEKP